MWCPHRWVWKTQCSALLHALLLLLQVTILNYGFGIETLYHTKAISIASASGPTAYKHCWLWHYRIWWVISYKTNIPQLIVFASVLGVQLRHFVWQTDTKNPYPYLWPITDLNVLKLFTSMQSMSSSSM